MKKAKYTVWAAYLIATISFLPIACSDKDDPAPANKKITIKFTLKVTGADEDDQIDIGITAANHDASQYGQPVWKINGATQGNENDILLNVQHFLGNTKTYVVETVKPFDFGGLDVHFLNYEGAPLTVSYKAEIDGKIETNVENLVIAAGRSEAKNFMYQSK